MVDPLVESAFASGRYVEVTTYRDGVTPIRASLLFKTAADATIVARVLRDAARPAEQVAVGVGGVGCEWLPIGKRHARNECAALCQPEYEYKAGPGWIEAPRAPEVE